MPDRLPAAAPPAVRIVRASEIAGPADWTAAVDRIFFASSATQSFADAAARACFRWQWLGTYVDENPGETFLAVAGDGAVVGYLVGALADPARDPRFASLWYLAALADLTAAYPAHLHVNVDPGWRGRGVGAALVAAFAAHASDHGAPGLHIVTGLGSRNIGFYEGNGLAILREVAQGVGKAVVMMGRRWG